MSTSRNGRRRFQSTLPVWGATIHAFVLAALGGISIHAPRVGSDTQYTGTDVELEVFQSTLPVWGATPLRGHEAMGMDISIHAPRVGSDN